MADEKDYAADVTKYADTVNTAALKEIVRYCGIALHKRDSSLVAGTQPKEVARVRDHFLRGKLALTASDQELDDAIKDVLGHTMKPNTASRG